MDPVRIACPSCRGKLVVRSEWLLGQTVICPRCKSNVQLPSSAGSSNSPSVVTSVSYDSGAITRVDDGQLAEVLAKPPEPQGSLLDVDDQAFESAIETFRPLHEELRVTITPFAIAPDRPIAQPALIETIARDDSRPIPSFDNWNHPSTQRRRQLLLIAMAGVVTTLVAIACFVAFVNHASKPNVVMQVPPPHDPSLVVPNQPPSDKSDENKSETKDNKANIPEISNTVEMGMSLEKPTPPLNETSVANSTVDIPGDLVASMPAKDMAAMILEKPPAIAGAKDKKGNLADNDPQSLDMPEAMKRYRDLFDSGSLTRLPDALGTEKPTDDSVLSSEKIDIETLYHPPSVTNPSWVEIQSVRIPRIATKDPIAISRLLVILGQLAGGGIGWDLDATRLSGFDVDQPVSLSSHASTIGELMAKLCSEHRLEVSVDSAGFPVLSPTFESISECLPADWSISDLATDQVSHDAWKDLLAKLYPAIVDKWSLHGSELQWSETASPLQKATVAAFLDQARAANGLQPKSKLAPSAIDPRLGLDESEIRISKPGTRINEQELSLADLLDKAARDVKIRLFFDWKSLSAHGFSFAKAATSLFRSRSLSAITKWGLDEFSLVAVVDGSDRVVLTTLPQQRSMTRTLLLKLEKDRTINSLRDSLRTLSPADEQGRPMLLVKPIPILSDPSDSWVVVRLCPPSTLQLQNRLVRDAIGLPSLQKKQAE